MASNRKETELSIFEKWRKTEDKSHFQDLYKSMKPLIYDAARKASYGSNIPESAHRIYAAQSMLDALKTFDPSRGASLQTHVYTAVHQKSKRLNYLYQNLGHIPEPRAQAIGLYQNEYATMKDSMGREPSAAELADRLGWGIKQVAHIQREIQKDLAMGEGTEEYPFFESSRDEEILQYLYFDLANEEKVVYDYIFGKNGKQRLRKINGKVDYDKISERMGVSVSKARSLANSIGKKLDQALKK